MGAERELLREAAEALRELGELVAALDNILAAYRLGEYRMLSGKSLDVADRKPEIMRQGGAALARIEEALAEPAGCAGGEACAIGVCSAHRREPAGCPECGGQPFDQREWPEGVTSCPECGGSGRKPHFNWGTFSDGEVPCPRGCKPKEGKSS